MHVWHSPTCLICREQLVCAVALTAAPFFQWIGQEPGNMVSLNLILSVSVAAAAAASPTATNVYAADSRPVAGGSFAAVPSLPKSATFPIAASVHQRQRHGCAYTLWHTLATLFGWASGPVPARELGNRVHKPSTAKNLAAGTRHDWTAATIVHQGDLSNAARLISAGSLPLRNLV